MISIYSRSKGRTTGPAGGGGNVWGEEMPRETSWRMSGSNDKKKTHSKEKWHKIQKSTCLEGSGVACTLEKEKWRARGVRGGWDVNVD